MKWLYDVFISGTSYITRVSLLAGAQEEVNVMTG
jgi:hypothetical protein